MARIRRVRIRSYKAFEDSGDVELSPHFTVVIGRNNGGKTALLQAIANRISDTPHRSLATVPERGRGVAPPYLTWELACGLDDFMRTAAAGDPVSFPLPRNVDWSDPISGARRASELVPDGAVTLKVQRNYSNFFSELDGGFDVPFAISDYVLLKQNGGASHSSKPVNGWAAKVAQAIARRVYLFNAERLRVDSAEVAHKEILKPDASNLAACLHTLQSNPDRYAEFNRLVTEVLPEVKWVSVHTLPDTSPARCQIRVWLIDRTTQREDLALPLSECGTGVGQVLAILYVVLSFDIPTTIVIDEPQSFLHPGATSKLMEILRARTDRHQFVVSTHSPSVIAATDAEVVLNVSLEGERAQVRRINTGEISDLRSLLANVGARWSDVFGADRVLWVEGQTEELAFPKILHAAGVPLLGTRVLGIVNTGDFHAKNRRKARLVREVYSRLSEASALLPTAVGFVFDADGQTPQERQEAERDSNGRIRFLSRRMFENYLLDPDAISTALAVRGAKATPEDIAERLTRANSGSEAVPKDGKSRLKAGSPWLAEVHGAELLATIFHENLGDGYEFSKTRDSVELSEWITANKPERFAELTDLLKAVLGVRP